MDAPWEHVIEFGVPSRGCTGCRTRLDVVTLDTSTVAPHSHGLVPRRRACYGCGDEVSKQIVVAQDGRCGGCGWRGPLATVSFRDGDYTKDPDRERDGTSAPLCLLCRDGFRSALRELGWRTETVPVAA